MFFVLPAAKTDIILLKLLSCHSSPLGLHLPFLGLMEFFFMNSVCLESLLAIIYCFVILVAVSVFV